MTVIRYVTLAQRHLTFTWPLYIERMSVSVYHKVSILCDLKGVMILDVSAKIYL